MTGDSISAVPLIPSHMLKTASKRPFRTRSTQRPSMSTGTRVTV